jgi:hypothetical protein
MYFDEAFKVLCDKEKGFEMRYPETWRVEQSSPVLDQRSYNFQEPIFFNAGFASNVLEIEVTRLPEKDGFITLHDFFHGQIQNLEKTVQNLRIEKEGITRLSGISAKYVQCLVTDPQTNEKLWVMQYFLINNRQNYVIRCACPFSLLSQYTLLFHSILNSFQLTN